MRGAVINGRLYRDRRRRRQSPFSPDPPPNSSAPDKSKTIAEPPRYHPNSTQHPDETFESNPMKMIRHDGKSQQVDPERAGQSLSLIFNHHIAVIIILAAHRVVTQQITATNHAIHHMHNRIRRRHFRSSHPRHLPLQIKTGDPNNLSNIATHFQASSVSPRLARFICGHTVSPLNCHHRASLRRHCNFGLYIRIEPHVFVIWSNLKSPTRWQQKEWNRRRTPVSQMVHMKWNKKNRGVRPIACPDKPPGRVTAWRYSNSVYRKNSVTDVSRDSNCQLVWTGDDFGSVFSTNAFLSLMYLFIHIFTTQKATSFVLRTLTKTRPALRNNQDNEIVLLLMISSMLVKTNQVWQNNMSV